MKLFSLFRPRASAPVARERLQILLSHERSARGKPDLLGIRRDHQARSASNGSRRDHQTHITVERDNVQVRMDRGMMVSTLAIDVEILRRNAAAAKS